MRLEGKEAIFGRKKAEKVKEMITITYEEVQAGQVSLPMNDFFRKSFSS
jgi:hypothetical protein